jgi:Tol biopolymer transport system component
VISTVFYSSSKREPAEVLRAAIVPPPGVNFGGDNAGALTISPDGRYVTFVARTAGVSRLWVRRLDQIEAQPLAGTDGATYPFWSPDSKQIGFFSNRRLKRVAATGGAVVTITSDVRDSRGGTWGANDTIVYSHHWRSPLYVIHANGGKATPVTKLDEARRETTHRFPHFLPDGERFLYLAGSHISETTSADNAIYVGSVSGKEPPKLIMHARSNALFAAGHLLFHRDGRLMAQRFDPEELALEGEAVPIAENVRYEKGFFRAVFGATAGGTLVYQRGGSTTNSELVWYDRAGKRLGTLGEPADAFDVRISPDGEHALVALDDPSDLWLFNVKRGTRARLTSDMFNEQNGVFSPDGKTVLYSSDRSAVYDTFQRSLAGPSGETPLLAARNLNHNPHDWTDGYIIFDREDLTTQAQADLWALPLDGRKPFPLVRTEGNDTSGRVSPDGRWLAYVSTESGRPEIYVTSFPQPAGKWQVSQSGGYAPSWRRDGRELFYTYEDKLFAVPTTAGASFDAGTPVELFTAAMKSIPPPFYDAAADGNRFLVNVLVQDVDPEPITLVTNWRAALEK